MPDALVPRRQVIRATLALLFLLAATFPAAAEYHYRYEGSFSAAERHKLEAWVGEVRSGLESLVGPFPFDVDVYFQRVESGQPVAFSNTIRGWRQGIRLRVDPSYPLEYLLADWTAPHEFSHLALPFFSWRMKPSGPGEEVGPARPEGPDDGRPVRAFANFVCALSPAGLSPPRFAPPRSGAP